MFTLEHQWVEILGNCAEFEASTKRKFLSLENNLFEIASMYLPVIVGRNSPYGNNDPYHFLQINQLKAESYVYSK